MYFLYIATCITSYNLYAISKGETEDKMWYAKLY